MKRTNSPAVKAEEKPINRHEIPVSEDSPWVVELQNALSPFWASRLEYRPEKQEFVVVLEEARKGR